MVRGLLIGIAGLALVACGGAKEEAEAPEPAPPETVELDGAAPEGDVEPIKVVLCRPEGVAPSSLAIGPLEFTAEDDVDVTVENDMYGGYVLHISLPDEGAAALAEVTEQSLGQPLALKINGETVSSPVVQEPILGGKLQVTGAFSREEVAAMAQGFAEPCE